MTVVTIHDVYPPARVDAEPWISVRWEESTTNVGPWTVLETQALTPVDADPNNPQSRDLQTEAAALEAGWYRLVFIDADNDESRPTDPLLNAPSVASEVRPTLGQLGALLRARTVDDSGTERGTFTAGTRPTADQADHIITTALDLVLLRTGTNIASRYWPRVRSVILLLAAQLVETTYYPEQAANEQSAAQMYQDMYADALRSLEGQLSDDESTSPFGRLASIPIYGRDGDGLIPLVDASDV